MYCSAVRMLKISTKNRRLYKNTLGKPGYQEQWNKRIRLYKYKGMSLENKYEI